MMKQGFTLFEVLMALSILTSAVFIISDLQTRALFKVINERKEIERTFLAKKELYLGLLKPPEEEKPTVNRLEDAEITLSTQIQDIDKKSPLLDFKESIKILKTKAAWKQERSLFENFMTSFVYKPPKKEHEKKT